MLTVDLRVWIKQFCDARDDDWLARLLYRRSLRTRRLQAMRGHSYHQLLFPTFPQIRVKRSGPHLWQMPTLPTPAKTGTTAAKIFDLGH